MVGVFSEDDEDSGDPVAVLSAPEPPVMPEPQAQDEPVDAEIVEVTTPQPEVEGEGEGEGEGRWASREALVAELKARSITQQEAVMAAREIAAQLDLDTVPASVAEIVALPATHDRLGAWIDGYNEGDAPA